MYVRCTIPCEIYTIGPNQKLLDVSAAFYHKGYAGHLSLPGGESFEVPTLPKLLRFARKAQGLQITLCDEQCTTETAPLADLIQTERLPDLFRMMQILGGRVCRAIRNFGATPEMPERLAEKAVEAAEIESHFRKWSPETSGDGKSWTPIFPSTLASAFASLLPPLVSRDTELSQPAEIKVFLWPDIAEALEEDREPAPEQEFYTNAIGHLRQRNLRLAVLESIICLEIVLTQFLQQHLTISGHVPPQRIKKFLSPEIGLTARLSALLNLTLHESYMADIDLDKVLKVVEWRNRVTHRTGHLPRDLRGETVEDHVWAVLSLCRLLAERRDNIAATPELKTVAEALQKRFNVLWPLIWLKRSHRVRMDISFFTAPALEERQNIFELIASEAGKLFRNRDSRFDPSGHLTIHFKEVPEKTLGWFRAGSVQT